MVRVFWIDSTASEWALDENSSAGVSKANLVVSPLEFSTWQKFFFLTSLPKSGSDCREVIVWCVIHPYNYTAFGVQKLLAVPCVSRSRIFNSSI